MANHMKSNQIKIINEDNEQLYLSQESWDLLRDKTVLITGATGMLAACLVRFLVFLNRKDQLNIRLLLLARSERKIQNLFGALSGEFECFYQDVCQPLEFEGEIDFVIHAASNASPYHIKHEPVEIIQANVLGTMNLLELVKNKRVKNFLFMSTREVYGNLEGKEFIREDDFGSFDPLDSRSCYPESKRMAETLLQSYAIQHGVPFTTVRIAHSYGPGMFLNDGRVMSDLMGCAIDNQPIVLKSDGSALRSFCYVTDAVSAMLLVLLRGSVNNAYNIANENEEVSILQLANLLSDLGGGQHSVKHEISNDNVYCQYKRTKLCTRKIEALSWKPEVDLKSGLEKTVEFIG